MDAIQAETKARRKAWAEGGHPNITHVATEKLDELHAEKRAMRREIYRTAPDLEGADVRRGNPARGAR